MKVKLLIHLTIVLLFAGMAASAQTRVHTVHHAQQKHTAVLHRVVIQVSSADTMEHKGLFNNLKHIKEVWGDSVMIEVVIHGPGLALAVIGKSTQSQAVGEMIQQGVRFVVCRNSMKQQHVGEDQILPGIGFVPSGVREIILKQEEGYSYLKAGF